MHVIFLQFNKIQVREYLGMTVLFDHDVKDSARWPGSSSG